MSSSKRNHADEPEDVYVLSTISVDHANHHRPEHSVVGVYSSKAAAARAAGSVQTEYGTFDEAIDQMFEDDHIDNRENPPDMGCLLQIGSRDTGEGDFVGLKIQKFPLHTMLSVELANPFKKSKKDSSDDDDDDDDDKDDVDEAATTTT